MQPIEYAHCLVHESYIVGEVSFSERARLSSLNLSSLFHPLGEKNISSRSSSLAISQGVYPLAFLDYKISIEGIAKIEDLSVISKVVEDAFLSVRMANIFLGYLQWRNPTCIGIAFSVKDYMREDGVVKFLAGSNGFINPHPEDNSFFRRDTPAVYE